MNKQDWYKILALGFAGLYVYEVHKKNAGQVGSYGPNFNTDKVVDFIIPKLNLNPQMGEPLRKVSKKILSRAIYGGGRLK